MASKKQKNVNLDALISREDFEASDSNENMASKISTLSVNDLKVGSGLFLASVRKPDFQRETADWDIEKIVRFIKSFVDGEFIPAVILWRSQTGLIFVIDGSHRLSSLMAWVNDDYGDGTFSLTAFDGEIPHEQRILAQKTREIVNKQIGSYEDFYKALTGQRHNPELITKARNLASRALQIQWIDGSVETAERSFFNINQQAAPIDQTELTLLQKRKKPNCIAARSIMRAGKGHKYWHQFTQEMQDQIERLADSVNRLLFEPIIHRPIKSLDIPICDKSNNLLTLVYDIVSLVNPESKDIEDDKDGEATVFSLRKTERLVQLFSSKEPCSYGLHPILYCYSNKGNFRPSSFYGAIEFIKNLNNNSDLLSKFISTRSAFEDFIFNNDSIIQQIIDTYRRGSQSAKYIAEYYCYLIEKFSEGKSETKIREEMSTHPRYSKLRIVLSSSSDATSVNFSSENKSAIFIKQAIENAPRCAICGGLLHMNSISIDHILRKRDGGTGSVDNGQLTHPYCNTGVKN